MFYRLLRLKLNTLRNCLLIVRELISILLNMEKLFSPRSTMVNEYFNNFSNKTTNTRIEDDKTCYDYSCPTHAPTPSHQSISFAVPWMTDEWSRQFLRWSHIGWSIFSTKWNQITRSTISFVCKSWHTRIGKWLIQWNKIKNLYWIGSIET